MHQSHKILNEQYTVTMSHTSSNWWRYNNLKVWTLKFKNLWLPLLYAHNKETSMNLSNSLGGDVTIQRYVNYSCLNMLSTTSFPVGHIRNITILFFIFLFSWWASQCYWSLKLTDQFWLVAEGVCTVLYNVEKKLPRTRWSKYAKICEETGKGGDNDNFCVWL